MKKILCLVMAVVMAVVIMAPMEVKASSSIESGDITLEARSGTPNITGFSPGYISDDQQGLSVSGYKVIVPISVTVSGFNSNKYLYGAFDVTLDTDFVFYGYGTYSIQVSNMYSDLGSDVRVVFKDRSKGQSIGNFNNENVGVSDSFLLYLDNGVYCPINYCRFTFFVEYTIQITGFVGSGSDVYYDALTSALSSVSLMGQTLRLSAGSKPPNMNWLSGSLTALSDRIDSLGTQIGNWFQTQWTFGRQWTDDIIDAIVGQSGGGSIVTAQDELDNQLNSIENVEQQLSDQVLEKVEVPSISLSSDETGGLNWVISTINSIYVAFDELHVMFACVVFFSICAVLLFGRRNL